MDEALSLTVVCQHCGGRFPRSRGTVAYCSPRCRQAAYRVRRDIQADIPASARKRRPAKVRPTPRMTPLQGRADACVTATATPLRGAVTRAEISSINQRAVGGKKTGFGAPRGWWWEDGDEPCLMDRRGELAARLSPRDGRWLLTWPCTIPEQWANNLGAGKRIAASMALAALGTPNNSNSTNQQVIT